MKHLLNLVSFAFVASLSFGFAACNDDDEKTSGATNAQAVAGEYWGSVAALYNGETTNYSEQTLAITANGDGTVNVIYNNEELGDYNLSNLTISGSQGNYTITGTSYVKVTSSSGESNYRYTLTANIASASSASFVYTVEMDSNKVITFTAAEKPDVSGAEAIKGSYTGTANYTAGGEESYAFGETFTIDSNTDGTIDFYYANSDFGTYALSNLSVATSEDSYTASGEGGDYSLMLSIGKDLSYATFTIRKSNGSKVFFTTDPSYMSALVEGEYAGESNILLYNGVGFTHYYQSLTITDNMDGTVDFYYQTTPVDAGRGEYDVKNMAVTVTPNKYGRNVLTMNGTGTCTIDSDVNGGTYEFTLEVIVDHKNAITTAVIIIEGANLYINFTTDTE